MPLVAKIKVDPWTLEPSPEMQGPQEMARGGLSVQPLTLELAEALVRLYISVQCRAISGVPW